MTLEMKNFWSKIISSKESHSSKRFITLIIAGHFIVASFVILFFSFYLIVSVPKGTVNLDLINLLKNVLEYDFYIILSGLGFITADNLGQILIEKAKTVASNIITPTASPTLPTSPTTVTNTTTGPATITQPVDPNNIPEN
jgi:hypothetical protein